MHFFYITRLTHIYLNAKVSQLLLKCYFLLFEPNILLQDIVIIKSNDLSSKRHENQTSETYDCRSSTRNVRQPKFEKSQSYNTLHFIESQCYTTLHFIRKRCLIKRIYWHADLWRYRVNKTGNEDQMVMAFNVTTTTREDRNKMSP